MKSLISLLVVASGATAFALPAATTVEPTTTVEWRFVGFTRTETNGRVVAGDLEGYPAMHTLCATEVAVNARACFTSEVIRSVVPYQGSPTAGGWVIPSGITLIYSPDGPRWLALDEAAGQPWIDENPIDAIFGLNCGEFRGFGLGRRAPVLSDRGLGVFPCTEEYAIACCAPVAVPLSP